MAKLISVDKEDNQADSPTLLIALLPEVDKLLKNLYAIA